MTEHIVVKYADHSNSLVIYDHHTEQRADNVTELTLTWLPGQMVTGKMKIIVNMYTPEAEEVEVDVIVHPNFD